MQDVTAESAKKNASMRGNDHETSSEAMPLDRRYGRIGISAVAAAARYQGDDKDPACASESAKWRDLFAEAAA
jgi:hypothetical protein